MRKPPRPASLVLGLAVVVIAIWRFLTCSASPPAALSGLLATPSASAPAKAPPKRARSSGPAAPIALLSASAAPDEGAALGAFEGRVVSSATGQGIGGARLFLEHGGTSTQVVSAPDGAFRLVPSVAGTFTLIHADAVGYRPYEPLHDASRIAWTARPGARVSGFVLALDPEAPIVVTVQGPDGKPIEGAEVLMLDSTEGTSAQSWTTDAHGEARADVRRDDLIEARHASFAAVRTRVPLSAEASHALTIRLRAKGDGGVEDASAAIAGRVVDAEGAPVAGASVTASIVVANRAAAGADLHPRRVAVSGEGGKFRIESLDRGTYDLIAEDDEHAPARAEGVAAGAEDVVLRLGDGGSIRGTVRDKAGKPVAAFSVVVSIVRGPLEREHAATRSFLDAEGRYAIEGLAPDDYEVVAAALGAAPSSPAKATIADPPGAPITVDLTLAKGATLRGTVADRETKKPIAGARVELEGMLAREGDVPLLATAATGADGVFELGGLAEGVRSLSVSAEGHHGRIVSGIAVGASAEDPPPIAVFLTPTKKGETPGIELVGIGAVLTAKDDVLLIGQVIEGGGAMEAGLGPGDAVLAIDGVNVTELGFEGSIGKIRGPEDSTVLLTVRKAGATGTIDLVVPRRRIKG